MKTSITYRRIWNIAYPIILGSIAQNIISVTDTAFLGRVGQVALGAGAIGGIFYLTIIMLGWGFGIGTQIIVARRHGEENYTQIGSTIEHSLYFLLLLALFSFLVIKFFSTYLLQPALKSEEVFTESVNYLNYRGYGVFFAFINYTFRAFYTGIARTKIITWTTLVMAVFNIFFDYVLIFGNLGFPELGIKGAAMASVIAEISATIFFIFYTLRTVSLKFYGLFNFKSFQLKLFTRIVSISLPVMLQNFISIAGWFIFFLFVENLGEQELAVSNIIRSFYVVLMIPIWGFSSATNTLVSYLIGQKKPNEVLSLVSKIAKLCVFSVFILVIIGLIKPVSVLRFYTNDILLIQNSLPVLYVVSGSVLLMATAFIFFNGVSGTGKTNISLLIENGIIIIYLLAVYLTTHVYKLSIAKVWCVEYLYAILLVGLSFLYLKYGKWRSNRL